MGFLDSAVQAATKFANSERAYPLGESGIPVEYLMMGVDTSRYSPEMFGDYLVKSNPVFSVVTQRAAYLSMLPLRLFTFTGETAQMNIPRSDEALASLLHLLREKGYARQGRQITSQRNAILNLSAVRGVWNMEMALRKMGVEEVNGGDVFDLLHFINPFWSLNRLVRMMSMSLGIWGQTYLFIERGSTGRGVPREIWWAKPTKVFPIVDGEKYLLGYDYYPEDGGRPIFFEKEEVVRIYYPNPLDQFQALSPMGLSRVYADHENASMAANVNLHRQGLQPGAVVTPKHPMKWKENQARDIERKINTRMSGYDRAHRWATFRHDVQIHTTGISPKDSEFLGGMDYDIERIANAYHWPIDFLSGKRTYENVEQAQKIAWATVAAEGAFIAAELTELLLPSFKQTKQNKVDIFFFDTSGVPVLQETESVRWERERTQIDLTITRNEWRAGVGLPSHEGGDALYVSEQMVPIDSVWVGLPSNAGVDDLLGVKPDTVMEGPEDDNEPEPNFSANGSE